jgi:hypothetical protein
MPIIKCQNPECDYFQKLVPDGDYCPFCGEPLPGSQTSFPESIPQQSPTPLSSPFPPAVGLGNQGFSVSQSATPPIPQTPVVPPPISQPPPPVQQPPVTPAAIPQPPVQRPPVTPAAIPQPPVQQPPVTPAAIPQPPVQQPPVTPAAIPQPPVQQPIPVSSFLESAPTVWEPRVSGTPVLKLIHYSGKEFTVVAGQKSFIGRRGGQKKPHPEIDVTDIPHSERVSRPHAHIFWDESSKKYMIVDNQSANGTILNEETLKAWIPYSLENGATLELGREHLIKFTIQIR